MAGSMFAKEVAFAAKTGKLVMGIIDQPSFPSAQKDQAFHQSNLTPDFSPLLRILENETAYAPDLPLIADYLRDRQFFAIEGLRKKKPIMVSSKGLLKLHREVLSPQRTGPSLDWLDDLEPELRTIDRREQVQRLEGLATSVGASSAPAAAIHASTECSSSYLLERIGLTLRAVEWRDAFAPTQSERRRDFLNRVEEVLESLRSEAAAGAQPRGVLISTGLTFDSRKPASRAEVVRILAEWQSCVDDIQCPPGLKVLFCKVLEDEAYLNAPWNLEGEVSSALVQLGRLRLADLRDWLKRPSLQNCLKKGGLTRVTDESGYLVPAAEWIQDRFQEEFGSRDETSGPTMNEAVRFARKTVQQAHRNCQGDGPNFSPDTGIRATAFR
jgi:hypothetical protein